MLHNFQEFLLENLLFSLNESRVIFSDNFTSMLRKIDSPISKELLSIQDSDEDVTTNYFDIDTKDTISFITDKKAQELQKDDEQWVRILNTDSHPYLWYNPDPLMFPTRMSLSRQLIEELKSMGIDNPDLNFKPELNQIGKIILTRQFGYPYEPFHVIQFGVGNYFATTSNNCEPVETAWVKNRQPIRVGRGIKALLRALGKNFSDADIEKFVNLWKAEFGWVKNAFRNFELVTGEKIPYYYLYDRYEKGNASIGTLGNSCMRAKPDYYFDLYAENPEVCQLLILKSEKLQNRITGRALIWKLDSGEKFMDRVYYYQESDAQLFRNWAKENKYLYKSSDTSRDDFFILNPDGKVSSNKKLEVSLRNIKYPAYPYMDTLKYMYDDYEDKIVISNINENAPWLLESVQGSRFKNNCQRCQNTGHIQCTRCYGDGIITKKCQECNGYGSVKCCTHEDCQDCSGDGFKQCLDCDEGKIIEDCPVCNGRGGIDCPDCS